MLPPLGRSYTCGHPPSTGAAAAAAGAAAGFDAAGFDAAGGCAPGFAAGCAAGFGAGCAWRATRVMGPCNTRLQPAIATITRRARVSNVIARLPSLGVRLTGGPRTDPW